jgi:hypothetical protein
MVYDLVYGSWYSPSAPPTGPVWFPGECTICHPASPLLPSLTLPGGCEAMGGSEDRQCSIKALRYLPP